MEAVIFLSPHYDDAVLSCASLIRREVSRGKEVTVITVFTKDQPHRKEENDQALRLLGAKSIDLDLSDAPERDCIKNRSGRILFGHPLEDPETLNLLIQKFQELSFENADVYAPLGIGWHLDHLLVHEASKQIISNRLFFYEDAPYNYSSTQKDLRFLFTEELKNQYLKDFFDLHYVKSWLSQWDSKDLLPFLKDLPLCDGEIVSGFSLENCQLKFDAIKCYNSQVPYLFADDEDIKQRMNTIPETYYMRDSHVNG